MTLDDKRWKADGDTLYIYSEGDLKQFIKEVLEEIWKRPNKAIEIIKQKAGPNLI